MKLLQFCFHSVVLSTAIRSGVSLKPAGSRPKNEGFFFSLPPRVENRHLSRAMSPRPQPLQLRIHLWNSACGTVISDAVVRG